MVKISLSKFGKNGSVDLEDEVEYTALSTRLLDLVRIMHRTVADMRIESFKETPDEQE